MSLSSLTAFLFLRRSFASGCVALKTASAGSEQVMQRKDAPPKCMDAWNVSPARTTVSDLTEGSLKASRIKSSKDVVVISLYDSPLLPCHCFVDRLENVSVDRMA